MQVVAEKSSPRIRMAANVAELRPAAKEHCGQEAGGGASFHRG
jgi:hypothetical protein